MSDREAQVILTANNEQYNKSIEESQKKTEKLNKALEKTSETATKITKATAKGLFKMGAAEVAGLTALSAVAATLEKQTSNIQSNLALNKTSSQYNAVTASIRAMSREMPIARAEIAQMATAVSGLGLTTAKQIGGVSNTFSKMGIATGESGAGLATSMVQFQRAMGVAQPTYQTMNPYANSVTGLSARAGTSAQGVIDFAQTFAPAARVAGLNQSSVLGISTAATRAGVDGTYAASTISQILNDITQLRYVQSPELGRYARALGMDSSELTRKTTGPEDQDKFLRNIVSRVVATAQSEEGPSRLSMMNIDGLRARKALQGLASDPGGIEKWINYAEFSRTQPNVETGFKAASGGLADQTAMLRNRATDVSQQLGTPMMETLTSVTKGLNTLANVLQPLTNVVTSIVGRFGSLLGVATMGAGAILAAWGAFSKLNLLSRGVWNTGTQAMVAGARDGRNLAFAQQLGVKVPTSALSEVGQRLADKDQPSSAWQRMMYGVGGGLRSALPNDLRGGTIKETTARSLDRLAQWVVRGTQDIYAKGRIDDPSERYKARLAEQQVLKDYRSHIPAKGAEGPMPAPPVSPVTGIPLTYQQRNAEGVRFRDFGRTVAAGLVGTPLEATRTAGHIGWTRAVRPLGAAMWDRAVVSPWEGMRANQQEYGMRSWANQKVSGIGAGISAAAGNGMVQMVALTAAISALSQARGEYNQWAEKWSDKGGGISATELDNLSEYNEKLGLATRSLQSFTKGVDEANPAKSDDVNTELRNSKNVQDYGLRMDSLVNERMDSIKTVDQAKEWIASQGTMNADQWVLVMRDFSKVFKNNQAAFEELNKWVITNQKDGRVPGELTNLSTSALTEGFANTAVGTNPLQTGSGDGWRKWMSLPFASGLGLNLITGGDPAGIRGSEEFQSGAEFLVGSQASAAKTIGETKDASSLFGVKGRMTEDQQSILVKAEQVSQFVTTIGELSKEVGNGKTVEKINAARIALDQYIKSAGSAFGIDTSRLNARDITGNSFTVNSGDTQEVQDAVKAALAAAYPNNEDVKGLIDSGLLDKVLSGQRLSDQLPDLTVQTSSQQAVAGTAYANVDEATFEKYLGEGSMLGKGLLAAGQLSDPGNFQIATKQLLEFTKKIDSDRQSQLATGASRGDTSAFWETSRQPRSSNVREYALLEQMKINNDPGTQGYEIAKAAQAEVMRQASLSNVGMNSLERQRFNMSQVKSLTPQLTADPNKMSDDLIPTLMTARQKASDDQLAFQESVLAWGKTREREERDWNISIKRNEDSFYLQRRYSNEDFQRSMSRSRASFNRQFANSEAAFYRSLKYQSQDFYRGRQREEEAYQRQKKYAAEDTAKNIGDPYNRMQLQLLSDPQALAHNMEQRARLAELHVGNVDKLKNMGLSEQAAQQLNVNDFNNSQQVDYMAKTMTSEDIARFNAVAERLVAAGGDINERDTATQRAEEERNLALKNSLDDFIRNLKRTKIEHAIQVKFSKKEFEISIKDSEKEHEISLKRSREAYDLMMENAASDRAKALADQTEDLFGFAQSGLDNLDKVTEKIIGKDGYIATYGGELKTELKGVYTTTKNIIEEVDAALKKLDKFRSELPTNIKITSPSDPSQDGSAKSGAGNKSSRPQGRGGGAATSRARSDNTNQVGMCLAQVSDWLGVRGIKSVYDANEAWSESDEKHPSDKKAPAGKPVYWAGGAHGHVALSLGNQYVRSTDWPTAGKVGTTTIDGLSKAWGKTYRGWAGDAWGIKLAEGGILPAKAGGHKAIMAEAGSAEMAVPLNNRGIDFMSQFTKGVAREMTRSMPKTPVSASQINNSYDHSQNVRIEGMVVESNDPKKFLKELQKESQKKNAALYKA